MEKSGEILENCGTDLVNSDVPDSGYTLAFVT